MEPAFGLFHPRQLFNMCRCACELLGEGTTEFKEAKYYVSRQVY